MSPRTPTPRRRPSHEQLHPRLRARRHVFLHRQPGRQIEIPAYRPIDELRESLRLVRERHPFHIDAIVVLPEHLHTVWTLPPDDADYPTRWALIKAGFSRNLPRVERIASSRIAKGERGIWQRRYWEHQIRDEGDYARHVDYIHYNPVKHGHAQTPIAWPHSSLHRYVRDGILPADWSANYTERKAEWGE